MLDIAFELIGEATSNSLLMFCFCNLIIVIILTGSSKPGSLDSQYSPVSFSIASEDHGFGDDYHEEEMNVAAVAVSSAQDDSLIYDEDEDRESSCFCDDDDDDDDDEDDDDEEYEDDDNDEYEDDDENKEAEEEGDDELRKRVEEFIAKINNEWRHEKLKALNLVY